MGMFHQEVTNAGWDAELGRFELGPEPRTLEEFRSLQAQLPPLPDRPRLRRAEGRTRINAPVQLLWKTADGRQHTAMAQALDVAASSVYFEVDVGAGLASPKLLLELEAGREISLYVLAHVARVEAKDGKIGVAVVLEDYCV